MTTAGVPATVHEAVAGLRGGLLVSCQARAGEPLHGPDHMVAMARSVVAGGAVGLRVEGVEDVRAVSLATQVPLIGLWKEGDPDGVYITPTVDHAVAVADAGADLVAVDGTDRPRPDGSTLLDLVAVVHGRGALVVADVSTYDEGLAAQAAGADLVATTLAGYTPATRSAAEQSAGPALDLVGRLAGRLDVPVVAEGRYSTPEQARLAIERGAWCVVVGTAITRPTAITAGFAGAVASALAGREGAPS